MKPSKLVLKNSMTFLGQSPIWQKDLFYGEVVFNTGMTGYVESLTDPSYKGQIVCFTYPLIGNYGVPAKTHWESKKIHASGVIISQLSSSYQHYEAKQSFLEWLKQQQIPLITDVDTRSLTKTLRQSGVMLGAIACKNSKTYSFIDPNKENLVDQVCDKKKTLFGTHKKRIIFVDCGMKEAQLRILQQFPISILKVPYDYDYTEEKYDGIFLSNGPGDPSQCKATIAILKKAMLIKKPIFGICLGMQLLALAAGAKAYKLPYGHRGQNQPCQDLETKRCFITSQNHGYAIAENSIPKSWKISFRHLNDDSVAGITHKTLPYFSTQFHPEANAGPTDTQFLFEKFYALL